MDKILFPPVETSTPDGLLAIGGNLEVETLISAYKQGIFPWPISKEYPLAWFSPDPRGVLFLENLHLPKSFVKFLKKNTLKSSFNKAFSEVIHQCSTVSRKNQSSTWITPEIIKSYEKLFQQGLAYSVEVWDEERLIAGLYGVCMGDFVSGESMFNLEDNGSKFALYELVKQLKSKNIKWIDTQMVTPVVEIFGGKYISRPNFLKLLTQTDWTKKRKEIF
jgi:leucyl/phenylalanyl-tRNA--protein transferase